MDKIKVNIAAFGSAVPDYVLHNNDLSHYVDTSHDWIKTRTGIDTRHISLNQSENTSGLCTKAALEILKGAAISADEIDLIITATMSPDFLSPSTACIVQNNIGAVNAFAYDINAACSGFIYALYTAENMLRGGKYKTALVLGGDVLSKILDWKDRKTCVLFGDGAGGVLLKAGPKEKESFYYTDIHSNGMKYDRLIAHHIPLKNPFLKESMGNESPGVLMDGRGIFDFAVRNIPSSINKVLEETGFDLADIKYIVPHQANYRIAEAIAKKMKTGMDKFYMNIDKYGNTTAGTIPIALSEMHENGLIEKGNKLILTGFGGGLTWGTTLIEI